MLLLDTDIVIWITRAKKSIVEAVYNLAKDKNENTGVSTITVAEVCAGILPEEVERIETFFDQQEIVPVAREIARTGGYYWQQHRRKFKNLSLADCLVAATAQNKNATLVTLNTKHYPMTDIKVISPAKLLR